MRLLRNYLSKVNSNLVCLAALGEGGGRGFVGREGGEGLTPPTAALITGHEKCFYHVTIFM